MAGENQLVVRGQLLAAFVCGNYFVFVLEDWKRVAGSTVFVKVSTVRSKLGPSLACVDPDDLKSGSVPAHAVEADSRDKPAVTVPTARPVLKRGRFQRCDVGLFERGCLFGTWCAGEGEFVVLNVDDRSRERGEASEVVVARMRCVDIGEVAGMEVHPLQFEWRSLGALSFIEDILVCQSSIPGSRMREQSMATCTAGDLVGWERYRNSPMGIHPPRRRCAGKTTVHSDECQYMNRASNNVLLGI